MCARYTLFTEDEIIEIREIIAEVEKKIYGDQKLSKNEIYPSNIAPVVTSNGAEPMKWGFPNPNGKGILINARSETVFEKPLFWTAHRLCC